MICKMGPDIELKGKVESAPEVHFSKEIFPAPTFSERKDFQPTISKCSACANEALPIEKSPLSNGNEDVEVNITGSSNSGKTLVVEVACEDATEYSSSFGDTLSGTEIENCSAFSDVEVQSQIHSGNASSPMHDDCFEPFRIRKKKLTNHWRRFIHPLMWRCRWIELQLNQLQSQALKYDEELAIYDHRKQHEFANLTLDGFGTKSVPYTGSIGRNKVMKRKKRKRVEAECDLLSDMSNHSLFSYYENKNLADVVHLKDAPDVATGNAVNAEEFRWNDILSSLESKDSDKSLKDIILKIEAVHEQVHRLKTRIDVVINENPVKFTSVNKLSMHEPSDGLNHFERHSTSPAGARSKHAFPARSVKTEFNMGDLLMPGNEVSSCVEMSPLIETTCKPQHEVLWEDTKDGVLIQNHVAKEELQRFENVRNELVKTTDESFEERKSISPVRVLEPESATEIAANNLQPAVQACSTLKSNPSKNQRRRRRKSR
ncbi:uncharacterized protein LOC114726636 isoform X2 [Neltuma alba]|nr:uncharacterized protein LOC114726636 isoform X2 [Prosopis alba]XP_028769125.1 uncharacterized protein LOC114726636 isoform X2 [Prosopis alba]